MSNLTESIITEYINSSINESLSKNDIKELFGPPELVTFKNDACRVKALLYLYDFQTEDEQNSNTTHHHNKMGFNGTDAGILSSFAQQVINKGFLSVKQLKILREKIIKYAGQISKVAKEAEINGKDQFIKRQFDKWVNNSIKNYNK